MGRGNTCVRGQYEGLYYIDRDYTDVYTRRDENTDDEHESRLLGDLSYDELTGGEWEFDEYGSMEEYGYVEEQFIEDFTKMFRSFKKPREERWIDREVRVLLENSLFVVGVEDNEWSMAVKLLQKEDPYDDHLLGLQKRHYESYLDGMKRALLMTLPSIGTYKGAWTSGRLTREEVFG